MSDDVICEPVDVYGDDDYGIPAFVFSPAARLESRVAQDKWERSYQVFGVRMARQNYVVLFSTTRLAAKRRRLKTRSSAE